MILYQVIHDDPQPPCKLNNSVPVDLETICLRCLEKDPLRRFQTAADLRDELNRCARNEPIVSRRISRFERVWRWSRRNPAIAGLAAALLASLVAGLAGTTLLWQQAEESATREARAATAAKRSEQATSQAKMKAEVAAAETRKYLELSQRDVFALQLARASSVGRETPAIGLRLLNDCDQQLRDFAWKHLQFSFDLERFTLPGTWTTQVISADGKQIAAGNERGTVVIWDMDTMQEVRRVHGPPAKVFAIDSNFRSFVTADTNKLRICEMDQGKVLIGLDVSQQPPNTVVYSPDGRHLAVFEVNRIVPSRSYLVDILTFETRHLAGGDDPLYGGRFSRNGKFLATRSKTGLVSILDTTSLEKNWETKTKPFFPRYVGLEFSKEDSSLVYCHEDSIRILDIPTKQTQTYTARLSSFNSCALSVDKNRVVGASQLGPIQFWDRISGATVRTLHSDAEKGQLQDRQKALVEVSFSPNGKHLLTRGTDSNAVKLWRTNPQGSYQSDQFKGVEHWDLVCHPNGAFCVLASPVRGSSNGWGLLEKPSSLRRMLVDQLSPAAKFQSLSSAAVSLALSRDGKLMVVGSGDGSIAIWDFTINEWRNRWTAHAKPITSLLVCDEGRAIVSASGNPLKSENAEELKIWSAESGEFLGVLDTPKCAVFALAVCENTERVAYGDSTGSVHIFRLTESQITADLSWP